MNIQLGKKKREHNGSEGQRRGDGNHWIVDISGLKYCWSWKPEDMSWKTEAGSKRVGCSSLR